MRQRGYLRSGEDQPRLGSATEKIRAARNLSARNISFLHPRRQAACGNRLRTRINIGMHQIKEMERSCALGKGGSVLMAGLGSEIQ